MYESTKRAADIVLAVVCLILLSPLLAVTAIVLSVTGEREILYFQQRIGYKNKPFRIWKFATMLKGSSKMPGGEITLRNDVRITPFGRILRITKINELPQLVNVLKGDMSFVGPRPLMRVSFEMYSADVQERVYNSRPGLTGIGSLVFRDEEKLVSESGMDPRTFYREHIYPYKGQLEMWYQDNKSLRVDFLLMVLTAWVIFFADSSPVRGILRDLPPRPRILHYGDQLQEAGSTR